MKERLEPNRSVINLKKKKPKESRRIGALQKKSCDEIEEELEKELREIIVKLFLEKTKKLELKANLDLEFIDDTYIVGESVYGEAFPFESPPRVWLQVFAPDATMNGIVEHICHELIHIQHPELKEEDKEFRKKVKACINL